MVGVVVVIFFQEHLSTLRLWEQVLNTLDNKETREQWRKLQFVSFSIKGFCHWEILLVIELRVYQFNFGRTLTSFVRA